MKPLSFSLCFSLLLTGLAFSEPAGELLFSDDFERTEDKPEMEQPGNGWGTNSKSRAKGVKQVDLDEGAMHITMAEVADHGVSVTQDIAFKDATIQMRFKFGEGDDLGINIADMKEKSVHAGHICLAKVRPNKVEITDLKTGRMKLENREARQAGTLAKDVQKEINKKSAYFDVDLSTDDWHDLQIEIKGETMTVSIDGKEVGEFTSPGIGHATKSRIRLAVNSEVWVDDIKVYGSL